MLPIVRTIVGLIIGWLGAALIERLSRLHVGPSPRPRLTTRRTFIRNAALGAVGVVLVQIGAGFTALLWPNTTGAFGGELTVRAEDVLPPGGEPFQYSPGRFYVVQTDDGLLALYWKCPHLGCTVPWVEEEGQFHCPCHGSVYAYNGERLAGPAPRPLDLMRVTVLEDGDILVDTGAITTRTTYQPEQAVPYRAE